MDLENTTQYGVRSVGVKEDIVTATFASDVVSDHHATVPADKDAPVGHEESA